jgi:hypothetical protein
MEPRNSPTWMGRDGATWKDGATEDKPGGAMNEEPKVRTVP